jgi:hypothetical protein
MHFKLIEGQGDLSREVYICLLHLMLRVLCASFIYINITTEDWVIVYKRNQLHMPLYKRRWGSRFR